VDKQRQLDDFFGISSSEENEDQKPKKHMGLKEVMDNKNKSLKAKLRLLPKILSTKERYIIFIFLLAIAGGLISIPITTYYHFTKPIADNGGTIVEGIVGEPRHINPLLSQTDADRDLIRLIYSGLFKYNENGKLVPDLAKSYEISPDELNYTLYLKESAKWHDDQPFTADDVIFTIETAQNTDYGSLQRINWQGVEFEKANDYTVIFKLKNKYAQFLNNLTLPILPKHLWENIQPINFALSELNLKPIGSGPFQFKKLQKDKSGRILLYELGAFQNFYDGEPFINKIQIKFYESEDSLIEAYNNNEVDNVGLISPGNINRIKFRQRLMIEEIEMPRYFGVFFNQNQSKILSNKNIRLALAHATDKQTLVQKIIDNRGTVIDSPMVGIFSAEGGSASGGDSNQDVKKYEFNKDLAQETLQKDGWDKTDENGIRIKGDEKLSLKLTTSTWPELTQVAEELKQQWKEIGVDLSIEVLPTSDLQQAIKEREYQMLLFGEILNLDPDPFSLWHSSQKRDPGLNLALYDNKSADTLLEEARKTLNPEERIKKYDDFQKLLVEDIPALFLYSPYYLYGHSKKVNGFANQVIATPSDRFFNVANWYIETKRVWR
jgi:peptide/nickel transport system substrate-binding protein